jgi:hypothetical protein
MSANPLPFQLDEQRCGEWCWATVAVAIGRFYHDASCPQDQCQLVSSILKVGKDCCEDCDCTLGSLESCNQPQNLGFVLSQLGHGRDDTDGLPSMKFEEIQMEINNGRPIAVSIAWQEPAAPGHAIVIHGYTEDRKLVVADPMAPPGTTITVSFDNFVYPEFGGDLTGDWKAAFRTVLAG